MPTYGYECLSCGAQTEVFQSIKDDPMTICDACGGTLRKRVYPVGIAFKGSGFYVNDYANKSTSPKSDVSMSDAPKSDAPKADATPAAASEPAKSEVKTESKPDVKTPTPTT